MPVTIQGVYPQVIKNAWLNVLNLHSNKYTQGLRYYPFAVNLDSCVGVLTFVMVYLMEYVFQTKKKI